VRNKNLYYHLEGMGRLNLIKIFQKPITGKVGRSKYKGAMSRQPLEEIDRQLNELRS
jgi:CRISPR/Cas system-associated endoribonuclease Cas2